MDSVMKSDYEEFMADWEELHSTIRRFSDKWEKNKRNIKLTRDEYIKVLHRWDQHEGWFDENVDCNNNIEMDIILNNEEQELDDSF